MRSRVARPWVDEVQRPVVVELSAFEAGVLLALASEYAGVYSHLVEDAILRSRQEPRLDGWLDTASACRHICARIRAQVRG